MDVQKIERAIRLLLEGIGENPDREGLNETPRRVAEMCQEIFSGIRRDPKTQVKIFDNHAFEDIVLLKDIPFYSFCEHHILPFYGQVHVAYVPRNSKITGLSKFARVIDTLARRLQVQERFTREIVQTLTATLKPKGILVLVEAEHLCMILRGVQKRGSRVTTLDTYGVLKTDKDFQSKALFMIYNNTYR